jgi:protein subunit release factor A
MRDMAEAEAYDLTAQCETLLEEIKDTFVMADDAAVDSVIMEIRPGTGGDEASLFARDLYEMYLRYAEKHGLEGRSDGLFHDGNGRRPRSDPVDQRRRRLGLARL